MFLSQSSRFLTRGLNSKVATAKSLSGASASSPLRHQCLVSVSRFSTQSDDEQFPLGEALFGVVKYWDRTKCYGHISAENAPPGTPDVFVHRNGIVSDLPADHFHSNPFLKPRERVQFKVIKNEKGYQASEVTFATGRPIPPLRKTFFLGRIERARDRAAKMLVESLEDGSATSPDMTMEQKAAFFDKFVDGYNREIENAVKVIEKMGMDVDDFPRDEEAFKAAQRKTNSNKSSGHDTASSLSSSTSTTSVDMENDPLEALMKSLDEDKKE